jgi:hypothetical protein
MALYQPFPPLPTKPFYCPDITIDDRFRVRGNSYALDRLDCAAAAILPSLGDPLAQQAVLIFCQHVMTQEYLAEYDNTLPARQRTPTPQFDYNDYPPLELQGVRNRDY